MAGRSCRECREFMFEDNGDRMGLPVVLADGSRQKRPALAATPCYKCPKVPADTRAGLGRAGRKVLPEHAVEPTDRSRVALWHYRQCRAVGRFPDDSIVRRNAAILVEVERVAEECQRAESALSVVGCLLAARRK